MVLRVSKMAARRYLLYVQGLLEAPGIRPWRSELRGRAGVIRALERLEAVQLDPIAVVERNHHLVLRNRVAGYRPEHLDGLFAAGEVFEYLANARCVLPMRDLPAFWPIMLAARQLPAREALAGSMVDVLRRLREAGPLQPRDLGNDGPRLMGIGYNPPDKPSKASGRALDLLWLGGEVFVARREGNEKWYDLGERFLPRRVAAGLPEGPETLRSPLLRDEQERVRAAEQERLPAAEQGRLPAAEQGRLSAEERESLPTEGRESKPAEGQASLPAEGQASKPAEEQAGLRPPESVDEPGSGPTRDGGAAQVLTEVDVSRPWSAPQVTEGEAGWQGFLLDKYMRAYRLADLGDFRFGWQTYTAARRRELAEEKVAAGEWVEVAIEGVRRRYYALAADRPLLEAAEGWEPRPAVRFIAPLDNLLWRRPRLQDLFDFDYTWEVYTPAAKRRYGYYAMPILHGDRLIGRMDPRLDRQRGVLLVNRLQLEPEAAGDVRVRRRVERALHEFARWHGAGEVRILQLDPAP